MNVSVGIDKIYLPNSKMKKKEKKRNSVNIYTAQRSAVQMQITLLSRAKQPQQRAALMQDVT